jgi:hypothetical protein
VRSGGLEDGQEVPEPALPWHRLHRAKPEEVSEEPVVSWDLVITVVTSSVSCLFILFTVAVVVRQRRAGKRRPAEAARPELQLTPSSSSLASSRPGESAASFQQRFRHFQPELQQQEWPPEDWREEGDQQPAACRCGVSVHYSISYNAPLPCRPACHRPRGPLGVPDLGLGPGMDPGLGPGLSPGLGPGLSPGLGPGIDPGLGPGQPKALLGGASVASGEASVGPGRYRSLVMEHMVEGAARRRRDSLVCDV